MDEPTKLEEPAIPVETLHDPEKNFREFLEDQSHDKNRVNVTKQAKKVVLELALSLTLLLYLSVSGWRWLEAITAWSGSGYFHAIVFCSIMFLFMYAANLFAAGQVKEQVAKLGKIGATLALGFGAAVTVILAAIMSVGFYALLWHFPNTWWIFFAMVSVVWVVATTALASRLGNGVTRGLTADESWLQETVDELVAKVSKIDHADVRVMEKSKTFINNVIVVGTGRQKKIFVGANVLKCLTREETRAVLAHEVGHIARHHNLKRHVLILASSVGAYYLASLVLPQLAVLTGHASLTEVSAYALFALTLTVFKFISTTGNLYVSRLEEFDADKFAVESTGDVTAFRTAVTKITAMVGDDMSVPLWAVLLTRAHPSTNARIARAERVAQRQPKAA